MRFGLDGYTYREIADVYKLSTSRISYKVAEAMRKIREVIAHDKKRFQNNAIVFSLDSSHPCVG